MYVVEEATTIGDSYPVNCRVGYLNNEMRIGIGYIPIKITGIKLYGHGKIKIAILVGARGQGYIFNLYRFGNIVHRNKPLRDKNFG